MKMGKLKEFFCGAKKGMKEFGETISIIVNSVLLAIIYVIGVGVTSIIAKIVGKKFLDRKKSKGKKTYWSDLNLKTEKIDEYYKQY